VLSAVLGDVRGPVRQRCGLGGRGVCGTETVAPRAQARYNRAYSMSIEAVVFDWGGTLSFYADIELIDMWHLAAERLALETGRDAAELRDRLLAAELRYWDEVKQTQRAGTLHDILEAESRALGLDVTSAVISQVADRHLDAWTPHIRHHPDAAAALQALRAQGCKIGLLSNTHWPEAFHEHFLERDGLASLIDVRAYTSNMSHSKPHREAFQHILGRLGVVAERAVMVGDRPIDDVWGAQQFGMRGVWRPHAASPALGDVKPDAIIEQLTQLSALITNW
jgi:putative hydrolase of the HAD superfamily